MKVTALKIALFNKFFSDSSDVLLSASPTFGEKEKITATSFCSTQSILLLEMPLWFNQIWREMPTKDGAGRAKH